MPLLLNNKRNSVPHSVILSRFDDLFQGVGTGTGFLPGMRYGLDQYPSVLYFMELSRSLHLRNTDLGLRNNS